MFEQPRFRAAVDFLQLRAAAHQFDSVLAQWWMDLANSDDAGRAQILEDLAKQPRDTGTAPASRTRTRRRRGPNRSNAKTSGESSEGGGNTYDPT